MYKFDISTCISQFFKHTRGCVTSKLEKRESAFFLFIYILTLLFIMYIKNLIYTFTYNKSIE